MSIRDYVTGMLPEMSWEQTISSVVSVACADRRHGPEVESKITKAVLASGLKGEELFDFIVSQFQEVERDRVA